MPDPTPIPDAELADWPPPARRITVGAPAGLEADVRPIEAVVDDASMGTRWSTRWVFTEEEVVRLGLGEPLYVSFYGPQLVVHSVSMLEPVGGEPHQEPGT